MLFREKGIYYEIAVVLLLVLFLGSTSLIYPFGRDQGEYAYIASAWLQGKVIYKEVFNVKPPLTHLLHALALKLFGHSMVAIRLFDLLWQCTTAVVILLISNLFYNKNRIGVLSAVLYGFYYYSVNYWHIAQTDGFITLPISLSVLMFFIAREKNKPFLWIISGMFLGISVLFKYPVGILLVFLLLIMLFSPKKPIKLEYINILYLSAGFILPVLIFILSLFANNALHDFLYIQFNFITKYSIGNGSDASNLALMINNLIGNFIKAVWTGNLIFACAPIIILCEIFYLSRKKESINSFLIVFWWIAAVIHLVVQNKYYLYHRLPLYAPLSIITSHLIYVGYIKARKYASAQLLKTLFVSILLFLFYVKDYNSGGHESYYNRYKALCDILLRHRNFRSLYMDRQLNFGARTPDFSLRANLEAAEYIKKDSTSNDTIYVWGFEPLIYFLSERNCSSRFIYNFPLYGNFSWKEQFRKEFIKEIKANKPKFILVVRGDSIPWVTGTKDSSMAAFSKFSEFYNFTKKEYELSTFIQNFIILRRKATESPMVRHFQ